MEHKGWQMTPAKILYEPMPSNFAHQINRCYHCQCCGNGCPFINAMSHRPNVVIRMLQFGLIEEVLASSTIWICVACNTCAVQCPMAVDIPQLMDDLRSMALDRKVPAAEPDVLRFHQAVLESIQRFGRANKLDIMMRYKFKSRQWIQDWRVGLKLLVKRKLELMPSKVDQLEDVRRLFRFQPQEQTND